MSNDSSDHDGKTSESYYNEREEVETLHSFLESLESLGEKQMQNTEPPTIAETSQSCSSLG